MKLWKRNEDIAYFKAKYRHITASPAGYNDLPDWERRIIDKALKRNTGSEFARVPESRGGPAPAPAPQRVVRRSTAVVFFRRRRRS